MPAGAIGKHPLHQLLGKVTSPRMRHFPKRKMISPSHPPSSPLYCRIRTAREKIIDFPLSERRTSRVTVGGDAAAAAAATRGNRCASASVPPLPRTYKTRTRGGRSSPSPPRPPSHLVTINTSNSRMTSRFLNWKERTSCGIGISPHCPKKILTARWT